VPEASTFFSLPEASVFTRALRSPGALAARAAFGAFAFFAAPLPFFFFATGGFLSGFLLPSASEASLPAVAPPSCPDRLVSSVIPELLSSVNWFS
jgi:hypothetical protein